MNYIDIHSHLNFSDYDADREEVIKRTQEAGVGMITVGTDIESSRRAVELAETHGEMWATVGIHPTEVTEATESSVDFSVLKELAAHPNVVAIGECGLDYFHSNPEDIHSQREIFLRHIELANEVRKPLMLHIRNVKKSIEMIGNAYQEALQILTERSKVRANFHFFAGTLQDLKDIVSAGHTVSFTGVLTFTSDYDELVKMVPISNIMSETDCPFVAPTPYRGKRNEPAHVREVVKAIARIRGENEEVVARQIIENTKAFFIKI